MTAPVRIAIVGLGKIARDQHVPVLETHAGFKIAAVASRNAGLEGVAHFNTLEDLLASDVAIDAVSLCQPPSVRFDAAMAAIAAGKHVFLEKPPGTTLSEVEALADAARAAGVTLFTSWHSRFASGVATARRWLADRQLKSVKIIWKEDVRVWHPGQTWIWEAGGFGVFDPGINALSIATEVLPDPFFLTSGLLSFPSNQASPVAADLVFRDRRGTPITAEFNFLQTGPQTWDIRVETDGGELVLSKGGSELFIDGAQQPTEPEAEYRGLYDRFAALVAAGQSDVDISPLRHVADAFMLGERREVEPFIE